MFDFRYHSISLVAVFLALAVGLVLGVAIGDKGLVSSAEKGVRESLHSDLDHANAHIGELNAELDRRKRFEQQAFPPLVSGRLLSVRIGIVFLGEELDGVTEKVTHAVEEAGGVVVSSAVLSEPPNLFDLDGRLRGTPYAGLSSDPALITPLARRVGRQVVKGGRLVERVRRTLFSSSQLRTRGLGGVVVVRDPPTGLHGHAAALSRLLERGFVRGMNSTAVPVVGVETSSTSPSQVEWYRSHDLASVDDVDGLAGQAALVFALTGVDGTFGVKPTADAILPKVVAPAPK